MIDLIEKLTKKLAWPLTPMRKQFVYFETFNNFFYKSLSLRHINFLHFTTSCQNNFPQYM